MAAIPPMNDNEESTSDDFISLVVVVVVVVVVVGAMHGGYSVILELGRRWSCGSKKAVGSTLVGERGVGFRRSSRGAMRTTTDDRWVTCARLSGGVCTSRTCRWFAVDALV